MKKLTCIAFAGAVASMASAQIVSSPSVNGWAQASTYSWDWRYVSSGGGRGSHNYQWEPIADQSTSMSATMPLTGTTGTQQSIGTWFSPHYNAGTWANNVFTNTATEAKFGSSLLANTSFDPSLGAKGGASVTGDVLDEFSFVLPNAANVIVNVTATPNTVVIFKNVTTGDEYISASGSAKLSTTLPGGCSYELFVHLINGASADAYKGTSSNVGVSKGYAYSTLILTPYTGDSGDGGDN